MKGQKMDGSIQVYYGNGRGKTTAALGLGIRAAGVGKQVIMVQFLKKKHSDTLDFLKKLEPELQIFRFEKAACGYSDLSPKEKQEQMLNIKNALGYSRKVLESIGSDEEEAAALMGAKGWTIFTKVTFPHIKWAFLYGVVLCTARAMGEFGAVSVLSGHLRGKTNTLPLHVEILYNEFQYVPAFAVSSILVILAVILLIARNVLEHKGKGEKGDVR